ncbi:hypothetical protein A9Q88_00670 [Gammaproteobacteria bacterium 50_400_T64]|nr:hypothetical protein A9Q88_00670 [Gammaproteobacteria bacterium 50_400_T64]
MQINSYQAITAISTSYPGHSQNQAANESASVSDANNAKHDRVTLSDRALKFMGNFQMSEQDITGFKNILGEAIDVNAYSDPKSYLASLSTGDREILRKSHGLAKPINVATLSHEGAYNLLLPPTEAKDLDNNGLTTVGSAQTFQYPPVNAPANVHAAWAEATKDMSDGERLLFQGNFMVTNIEANLRFDSAGNPIGIYEPNDPEYTNPWADKNFSYRGEAEKFLARLDDVKNQIPSDQYEHRKEQLNALLNALDKYHVA